MLQLKSKQSSIQTRNIPHITCPAQNTRLLTPCRCREPSNSSCMLSPLTRQWSQLIIVSCMQSIQQNKTLAKCVTHEEFDYLTFRKSVKFEKKLPPARPDADIHSSPQSLMAYHNMHKHDTNTMSTTTVNTMQHAQGDVLQ